MFKVYYIILFCLTSLFFSCDVFRLYTNGAKKYIVSTECGKIEVSAKTIRSSRYIIKFKVLEGSFDLNMDSIESFIKFSNTYEIGGLAVTYSSESVPRKIEKGDVMEILFFRNFITGSDTVWSTPNYKAKPVYGTPIKYTINLYPGNYLTCNNKPVITNVLGFMR